MSGSDSESSFYSDSSDASGSDKEEEIKKQTKNVKKSIPKAESSGSESEETSPSNPKARKDSESDSPPAKKGRGRPPKRKRTDETKKAKKSKTSAPKNPVDVSSVVEASSLRDDDFYSIVISQPRTLQNMIAGIVPLIEKDAYYVIRGDTLCLDALDDSHIALITMRLCGVSVDLSDEAKVLHDHDEGSKLFFKVNTNRFHQGLRIIRTFQSLMFNKKKGAESVDLVAFESDYVGSATCVSLPDDNTDDAKDEYEAIGLSEESYKWHIENIDVKEFQDIIQRANDFKSDVSVRIYGSDKEGEYFLWIGTMAEDGSKISTLNRISESTEDIEDDEGNTTTRSIFHMKQATDMATLDMVDNLEKEEPVYSETFATRYLSNFMKAAEQSSVMSLHFKEGDQKGKKPPMIMKYSVGSIKNGTSYLKFALAPKKK